MTTVFAIKVTIELFVIIALLIGFANEKKVAEFERVLLALVKVGVARAVPMLCTRIKFVLGNRYVR